MSKPTARLLLVQLLVQLFVQRIVRVRASRHRGPILLYNAPGMVWCCHRFVRDV